MPVNDADLQHELALPSPDGGGKKLVELLQEPSLNIRGIRSGSVGEQATNIVPTSRSLPRSPPRQRPRPATKVRTDRRLHPQTRFLRRGPRTDARANAAHTRIVAKVIDEGGYRASRTRMDLPVSKALVRVMQDATNNQTVVAPTLGGSVPMYIFEDLGLPWIGVPIVNYDNHQHSAGRKSPPRTTSGQGIETYAVLLADLDW